MTERPLPHPEGQNPRQPEQHPLLKHGPLPDWLADVPISNSKPTRVEFGKQGEKTVPIDVVVGALSSKVGTKIGAMSINPDIAHLFAQHTENTGWLNLPTEPTWIERTEENKWNVEVGDYKGTFTREELEKKVIDTLLPPEDEEPQEK